MGGLMNYMRILSLAVMLFLSGCTQEHKAVHKLDCVVSSVLYTKTGKTVDFKREDAIKNGYKYRLRVYDDGILLVNENVVADETDA